MSYSYVNSFFLPLFSPSPLLGYFWICYSQWVKVKGKEKNGKSCFVIAGEMFQGVWFQTNGRVLKNTYLWLLCFMNEEWWAGISNKIEKSDSSSLGWGPTMSMLPGLVLLGHLLYLEVPNPLFVSCNVPLALAGFKMACSNWFSEHDISPHPFPFKSVSLVFLSK